MKHIIFKASTLLLTILTVACVQDVAEEITQGSNIGELLQELSITGKDFQFENDTRSSVTIGDSGASFAWDEDDVIGIFPDKGDQVSFAMEQGAGTQTATFTGGGWALKPSAKYAAYYPHVYENRDLTKIPVSYVGQAQNGNANTEHIGAYDFMAAGVSTPENGAVGFDMQHMGALVQLTITIPEPSTLSKVVLYSTTKFTKTGTINLTTETPVITATTQSDTFEIVLNDVTTTAANEDVIVYFMIAPVDLSDSELTATIHFADGTTREVEIVGKNLQAGKAYRFTAEIEANFYLDGVAYMSNAGVLSEIMSIEDMNTITSLKIIGKINGSDILTLHTMPALKYLDLSKVNIVSGGKAYTYEEKRDEDVPVYTENNVVGLNMFSSLELEKIDLPTDITTIGKCAFEDCQKLTSITIPANVSTISSYAFKNCYGLKSVIIEGDITSIGSGCFNGCEKLESINIPNSVNYIGGEAFSGCSSLKYINIPQLSTIYEYTFAGCTALTNISIPDTVTRIEDGAFSNCKGLENVTIPNSVTYLSGFDGCVFSEITMPSGVETIGPHAFMSCKNLTSITIPKGVKYINYQAFYGCTGLSGILNIPDSVTDLGDQAFQDCAGLTSINLSSNLNYIGWNAFRDCSGVSTLTIPASVQTIGDSAFAGMQLTSVTSLMQHPPYDGDPFWNGAGTSKIEVLYVPSGCAEIYMSNANWSNSFNSIIELN